MNRILLAIVLALSWSGCDREKPEPVAPAEAPEWVKEAVARSKRQAEDPPRAVESADDSAEWFAEKPLLWQVKAKSGATSHLLGSFHIGTDFHGVQEMPPTVRTAFEASKTIALEADGGAIDPVALAPYTTLPKNKSLQRMLKQPEWELLLEELGLPPQQLDQMQPWVVVAQLSAKWIPDAGTRGMDDRFRILAQAHDKELFFLETLEQQAKLLMKITPGDMLQELLEEADEGKALMQKALADFRRGDAEALTAWAFEPEQMKEYPKFYDALFFERNEAWVELLAPKLEEGDILVIVGAGHLIGERSVVTLLRDEGYEVTRVE